LVVQEEPPAIAAKLHTPGVEIEYVRPGSFADLQGLEPGLVITRLNRHPTPNRDQFNAIAGKLKAGDPVVFEVMDPHHPENGINYVGGALQ
jgi:serine protease Do